MRRSLIASVSALALASAALGSDLCTVHSGQTELNLDHNLLSSAGVIAYSEDEAPGSGPIRLLPFSEVWDVVSDGGAFSRGQVQHRAGLLLSGAGGTVIENLLVSLDGSEAASGLQLVPGHIDFVDRGFAIVSIDQIIVSDSLAAAIGAPALAGQSIGSGFAELTLAVDTSVDQPGDDYADRGGCTPSTGPDVIVGDMPAISNYTPVGGIDAFSVATTSCNIGDVNLNWIASSPDHPVIPQNLYRLKTVNGSARFEQVGQSWLKHAFTALTGNVCCTCNGVGGAQLGIGCSDPYSSGRNGEQITTVGGLGPRFQVNPHNGVFIWPYMFRNTAHVTHTSVTRRLQVALADLDPAQNSGAAYYVESQYVTPRDSDARNQNNNCSYRRAVITGNASNTNASLSGTTVREKAAIRAWKDTDPTVTETLVDTPEATNPLGGDNTGLVILSAKATDLGGGVTHYEYALFNMNSDRAIDAFTVPVGAGATVTNIGFHDVFYHSGDGHNSAVGNVVNYDGTDWPGVYSGGNVSWTMPPATPVENSNALRWGTLYNFRFDVNRAPQTGNVTLSMFKSVAGRPDSVNASSVVPTPAPPPPCPGDVTGDNAVDLSDLAVLLGHFGMMGGATLQDGDLTGDGNVDLSDLAILLANFGTTCP
jgi:hypothetical protein